MDPSANKMGPNHYALVNKIKDLFPRDTVKCLAAWLKISTETARHRIKGSREFSLDDVTELLRAEQGFEILKALMSRAERKPQWWLACEPLMDLADAEILVAEARRRKDAVIKKRTGVIDALETEIRRAQTLAIHGQEQAGVHADALRSMGRMVAPRVKR